MAELPISLPNQLRMVARPLLTFFCLLLCFTVASTVRAQIPTTPSANPALLSVLDPGAMPTASAIPAHAAATGAHTVQPVSFQQPGIVQPSRRPTEQSTVRDMPADPSAEESIFPYTAHTSSRVAVRSGPSQQSYATDYLEPGDSVEVYRHDPDGWLAIRPPAGSFSLIKGSDARETSDPSLYQIVNHGAKAWVGTRVEQSHQPLSQLKLKRGEMVEVQSSIEIQDRNKVQVWLQVSPPAGEFRWVHSSTFYRAGEVAQAENYPTTDAAHIPGRSPGTRVASTDPNVVPSLDLEENTTADEPQWRAAQRQTPEKGYADYVANQGNPGTPTGNRDNQSLQNVSYAEQPTNTPPPAPRQPAPADLWDDAVRRLSQNSQGFYQEANQAAGGNYSPSPTATPGQNTVNHATSASAGQWNQHLNLLNQQLSQEIVKPAAQWNLAPLLQQSQVLLQSAPSAAQREAASALQQRIQGFLQLQKQKPTSSDLTAGLGGARYASAGNQFFPAGNTNATGMPQQQVNYENPFAAVGYLKELILDRGRQPNTFVLQDNNGKTICHITPLPGVQLHQALDKKIGVKGKTGFHPQLNLPHVSVETFDLLD